MIDIRLIVPTLIAAFLVQACNLAVSDRDPSRVVDIEAEQARIMELESQWSEKYGAGDLNGVMSLMAKEAVLIAPGSAPAVGIEAVRTATSSMLNAGPDAPEAAWKSTAAFVAPSGDMAYDYGEATTRSPDGSETTGYYLVVWVKRDGEWKVAADMFN